MKTSPTLTSLRFIRLRVFITYSSVKNILLPPIQFHRTSLRGYSDLMTPTFTVCSRTVCDALPCGRLFSYNEIQHPILPPHPTPSAPYLEPYQQSEPTHLRHHKQTPEAPHNCIYYYMYKTHITQPRNTTHNTFKPQQNHTVPHIHKFNTVYTTTWYTPVCCGIKNFVSTPVKCYTIGTVKHNTETEHTTHSRSLQSFKTPNKQLRNNTPAVV